METYIYDHVRTPRGKGKPDGSLHEVTPVWLASRPLAALRERNGFDTAHVDDVVMGCVIPVGEQRGNIARMAVLNADFHQSVPAVQCRASQWGRTAVPGPRTRKSRSAGMRIAGGTDEIVKNNVGERVLGLPPEPRADKNTPFSQLSR